MVNVRYNKRISEDDRYTNRMITFNPKHWKWCQSQTEPDEDIPEEEEE